MTRPTRPMEKPRKRFVDAAVAGVVRQDEDSDQERPGARTSSSPPSPHNPFQLIRLSIPAAAKSFPNPCRAGFLDSARSPVILRFACRFGETVKISALAILRVLARAE